MLEMAKCNPEVLKHTSFKEDQKFVTSVALRHGEAVLKYVPDLMRDKNFVFAVAKAIFDSSFKKSSTLPLKSEIDVLEYAPDLIKNDEFLIEAKKFPYLHAIDYALQFTGDAEFILKMMIGYERQGGTFRCSSMSSHMSGCEENRPDTMKPLEKLISPTLKDDNEFIKKAMLIDGNAWKIASENMREQLLADDDVLKQQSGNVDFMIEVIKKDGDKLNIASRTVLTDPKFKEKMRKDVPHAISKSYFEQFPDKKD